MSDERTLWELDWESESGEWVIIGSDWEIGVKNVLGGQTSSVNGGSRIWEIRGWTMGCSLGAWLGDSVFNGRSLGADWGLTSCELGGRTRIRELWNKGRGGPVWDVDWEEKW